MRIVGMMAVYNEADVVGHVLDFHIQQGLELVVIDNGSTDGSQEIIRERLGRGVAVLDRIVTDRFEWVRFLRRLVEMAAECRPEWGVLIGADEFLETPRAWAGEKLAEGLARQAAQGYDVVQFDAYEFWPTPDDREGEEDVRQRMRHYTWAGACNFRAFRWHPAVTLTEAGGHYPTYPPAVAARVSPDRFPLRHYRFRSVEHGMRKVFKERLPRFANDPVGWHVHYDNHRPEAEYFSRPAKDLSRYSEDGGWERVRCFDPNFGAHDPPDEDWMPPGLTREVAFADLREARAERDALRVELAAIKATRFWRIAHWLWSVERRLRRLLGRADRGWPPQ